MQDGNGVRRVVVSAGGEGVTVEDGVAPGVYALPQAAASLVDVWRSEALPPSNSGPDETTAGFELMPQGCLFRVITIEPNSGEPLWHQTATLDCNYIQAGAVELLWRGGSTRLGAGDCCVVRGVEHAWRVSAEQGVTIVAFSVAAGA